MLFRLLACLARKITGNMVSVSTIKSKFSVSASGSVLTLPLSVLTFTFSPTAIKLVMWDKAKVK